MARASPRPARLVLRDDERGSFVVLEAILVAMLILTAILFFTSVQRPSSGIDQGGIDLAQVSSDTLAILKVRTFTVAGNSQTLEGWVTNVTRGELLTVNAVHDFLEEVLPTGARYSLRLDNGVSNLTILSSGTATSPHGARASQIMLLPNWATYRNDTATLTVTPGQVIPSTSVATYDLVKPALGGTQYQCYRAPNSFSTLRDMDTASYGWITATAGNDTWASHWRGTASSTVPWKSDVGPSSQQVPKDLPYGRWRIYTSNTCSDTPIVVDVVPPGSRSVTATTSANSTAIVLTAGTLSDSDVGKTVVGPNLDAKTRIAAVASSTAGTLTVAATGASGTVTINPDSTFLPYSLQLVVWFGA